MIGESMMGNISAEDIFKRFGFGNFFNVPNFTFKQNVHVPEKIIKVDMTLEEMWTGCVKEITIDKKIFCDGCKGDGCKEKRNCDTCKGTGQIKNVNRNGFNVTIQQMDCQKCQKRGYEIVKGCDICNNSKYKSITDKIKLSFKPGVNMNDKILLQNRGDQITRDNFQNVIILVNQLPHFIFTRNGNNLLLSYQMDFTETLFGTTKNIYHINGEQITFTTDEIINPNKIYKMEGLGFNGGDLNIKFTVNYDTNKENIIEYLSKIINKDKIKEIESDRDHNKLLSKQLEEINSDIKQQCIDKDNTIGKLKQKEDELVNQIVNLNESLNDTIKQLQQEVNNKNKLLSNKEQVVSQLQQEVNNKEQVVSQLQQEVNDKEQVVSQLQQEVNDKEQVVSQLQQEVNNKNTIILQLSDDKDKLIKQLQLDSEGQLVLLQQQINEKDMELENIKRYVDVKDGVIEELRANVFDKSKMINDALDTSNATLNEYKQYLSKKDDIISKMELELETKDILILDLSNDNKLQEELKEKNNNIQELLKDNAEKEELINNTILQMNESNKTINDMKKD